MNLKKSVILGITLASAFILQACSTKPAETQPPTTAAVTTAPTTGAVTTEADTERDTTAGETTKGSAGNQADGSYQDGVYASAAKGYGGEISVTVTVEGGNITEVTIDGPDETDGIGTKAIDTLPDEIVEVQSADVDIISGATVTSQAILTAVTDALDKASVKE